MKVANERDAELEKLAIDTIRTLAIDAVQAAGSGHPGTPMAMAPVAYTLWQRFLRFDPSDSIWPNRDRFVLSMGHASTPLYALLHLTGTKAVNPAYETLGEPTVSLDDLRRFRQLDSKCPGHPEYRWTSGVETTTGPLGQGVATSVGMAIAGQWLAAHFNRPGYDLFDYDVYALAGDGCLMEGVSSEAASLAGHLRLSNLCWIYDSNRITIEGHTELAFSEDVATRFMSYGWNVTRVGDANDTEMLARAFGTFRDEHDRPTLIVVDSHIGWGAPNKQDTSGAHGEPLGESVVRETGRRTPSFSFRTASTSTSSAASVRVGVPHATTGSPSSRRTRQPIRSSPSSCAACSAVSCPTVGTRTCRSSSPMRTAFPAATRPAKC